MFDRWREPTLFRDQFGRLRDWVMYALFGVGFVVLVVGGTALLVHVRYRLLENECRRLGERTGMTADYEWSGCILTGSETVVVDA